MRRRFDPLLTIALTANLFEWYEFSLTAFMALELGRMFFPASNDRSALMCSFSVFATSYLARPVGSVVLGALGNRRGAAYALNVSMIGMAVPASLIAMIPTYADARYLGTALLVGLRIVQGFAAGGEMPLSGYVVALNAAAARRGLYSALVVVSGFFGMLLASAAVFSLPYMHTLFSSLAGTIGPVRSIDAWRWPFLLCAPLSIWIYSLRRSMPNHLDDRAPAARSRRPVWPLVQAAILVAFMEAHIYTDFAWMPSYLHSYLGVSTFHARSTNLVGFAVFSAATLAAGYATRWLDAGKLAWAGTISLALTSYPLFAALQRGSTDTLVLVQAAFGLMAGCLIGVVFVVLSDLFKDNWRSLGMAGTYSLSTALFGGTAPILCAYSFKATGWPAAPALYLSALGLPAAVVAWVLSSNRQNAVRLPDHASALEPASASSSIR